MFPCASPPLGGTKDNALTLPLGIGLCIGCSTSASAGEFTGPRFRRRIVRFCKSLGDAKPDFRKAWLTFKARG